MCEKDIPFTKLQFPIIIEKLYRVCAPCSTFFCAPFCLFLSCTINSMADTKDNNEGQQQQQQQPLENGEPAKTYEITATDHINKSLLESFRMHLQNSTMNVPDNSALDDDSNEFDE